MDALYLELPLRGHHFGIASCDLDAGVETGPVMGLNDLTTDYLVSSDAAVVRTLWAWEAVFRPTEWPAVKVEESVLLLDTEPRILLLDGFHRQVRAIPLVRFCRRLITVVGITEHKFVVTTTERIVVNGHRIEINFTIRTIGLIRRAAIVCPRR